MLKRGSQENGFEAVGIEEAIKRRLAADIARDIDKLEKVAPHAGTGIYLASVAQAKSVQDLGRLQVDIRARLAEISAKKSNRRSEYLQILVWSAAAFVCVLTLISLGGR